MMMMMMMMMRNNDDDDDYDRFSVGGLPYPSLAIGKEIKTSLWQPWS